MGQIAVMRRKRGRPSKADLAGPHSSVSHPPLLRRSTRRRSFRYCIIDYGEDYLDDDEEFRLDDDNDNDNDNDNEEEDEEEDGGVENQQQRRREKKLELVLKLPTTTTATTRVNNSNDTRPRPRVFVQPCAGGEPGIRRRYRKHRRKDEDEEEEEGEEHDEEESEAEEEEQDEEEVQERVRVVKKRKISGNECVEDEEEQDNEDNFNDERRGRNGEAKEEESVPRTPAGSRRHVTPLPEKKRLELILDKFQKKDTYGVYAEPVDPEELPDYHDVIDHPMDFATIRKKLANGAYRSLEQFESDVFLICTNAMQYNAPETIYHKQARSIKELAEKKFQRVRDYIERCKKEVKQPEHKTKTEQISKTEQSDVFVICSNAMQYNAPERIYHKQEKPRSIKVHAERKFQHVRDYIERCKKEVKEPEQVTKTEQILKTEQQSKFNNIVMKQMKKPIVPNAQEPVGSDFASGATLATAEPQKKSNAVQVRNGERQSNDGGILEDNSSFLPDNAAEKAEDQQSAKVLLPKFWRKSSVVVDENRRVTCDSSYQQVDSAESIFNTFEGEKKQLISVGLQGEHSYARSLARFAGTLGSVAWKLASKKIEQALPPGFKFGRGWVGEYEPPLTAVVFCETQYQNDTFSRKLHSAAEAKNERFPQNLVPAAGHILPAKGPSLGVKSSLVQSVGSKPPTPKSLVSKQTNPLSRESRPPENKNKLQNPHLRVSMRPENKVVKRVELHSPDIANQNGEHHTQKLPCVMEMPARPVETVTQSNSSLKPLPFKKPGSNGYAVTCGLHNGKSVNNSLDINQAISSPRSISSSPVVGVAPFSQRQEQVGGDSVQATQTASEHVQKLSNALNPLDAPLQIRPPSLPSSRRDNRNNAAASARMPIGVGRSKPLAEKPSTNTSQISADSLYNTSQNLQVHMLEFRGEVSVSRTTHFPPGKMGFPFQAFVPQPVKVNSDMQTQNRPMMLSQLAATDMCRWPLQSPWRGLSPHTPQREKQDKLPPDLNIAFQSPVDSQQPDLALQL